MEKDNEILNGRYFKIIAYGYWEMHEELHDFYANPILSRHSEHKDKSQSQSVENFEHSFNQFINT